MVYTYKQVREALKRAAAEGNMLFAAREAWLQDAANRAAYCGALCLESEFITILPGKSRVWASHTFFGKQDREENDWMVFYDRAPSAAMAADGSGIVIMDDPIEIQV